MNINLAIYDIAVAFVKSGNIDSKLYENILTGVRKIAPEGNSPRSGSRFGLRLALELGLGGNFPRSILTVTKNKINI